MDSPKKSKPSKASNPVCKNHPDRPAMAHYKAGYSLCSECLDKQLAESVLDHDVE